MLNQATITYLFEHANESADAILLRGKAPEGVDLQAAASAIEARRKIRDKVPQWYSVPQIEYPTSLSVEQCSSQACALYKQQFVMGLQIADITGGLGIDTYFFSLSAKQVDYYEKNEAIAAAATDNFKLLECSNIQVHNADSIEALSSCEKRYDLIYADPARRSASASRIFSISDCQPNIIAHRSLLFEHADALLVKVSPMADIAHTIAQLTECTDVHIISVAGECKEVLLLLRRGFSGQTTIHSVDLNRDGSMLYEPLTFTLQQEKEAVPVYAEELTGQLMIPSKSVLKSGAFRLICEKFGVKKLSAATHLYISEADCSTFPGRRFKIIDVIPFCSKTIKTISNKYPKANLLAMNVHISTDDLRRRMKLQDGGGLYIIAAASLSGNFFFVCEQISPCLPSCWSKMTI